MNDIHNLSTDQLRKIISIKEQIEHLQAQAQSIADGSDLPIPFLAKPRKKRRMSAAGRARIAAAARARWAKLRGDKNGKPAKKGKRRLSAAGRAAIIAAAKARWAKFRGASVAAKPAKKMDGRRSQAVKAKLAAIAVERLRKARADGKARL